MSLITLERPGNYIAGRFESPKNPEGELCIRSPADIDDVVSIHPWASSDLNRAVEAARDAFPAWRRLGEQGRREVLLRYQEKLRAHVAEITESIAREVGKPLWDARSEAQAMISKVDLMLGEGARYTQDIHIADLPGETRHRPHGVLAVLGPFNFPGHLPNGQIVPALFLGNTVVFKPSEKTPSVATWMARCFHEAGAPAGVFNVVQGDRRIAEPLVVHEGIDGILFTGSAEVGKKILARNANRPGLMLALELGGKNASIVLDDCDLERASRQIAFAAYASAGQRCTASSRVLVTRGVADHLLEKLAHAAKTAVVGYPLDEGVFLGPMISEQARTALRDAQLRARSAGFEAIVDGGPTDIANHRGWYVRPSLHRSPRADLHVPGYTHEELFGPDLAVHVVENLDEAITLANDTRYGLAAALFTRSRESFERAADELRVGVLHWNRPSAGASGRLPFGGVKDSGNHRPAGILAGTFCVYPQAVLLPGNEREALPSWPGLFSN